MEEKIVEFINRRFPIDCNWTTENCFYFAQILASRFHGDIVYDPINGHFLFLASDDNLYDWTGRCEYTQEQRKKMFFWHDSSLKDKLLHNYIYHNCVE